MRRTSTTTSSTTQQSSTLSLCLSSCHHLAIPWPRPLCHVPRMPARRAPPTPCCRSREWYQKPQCIRTATRSESSVYTSDPHSCRARTCRLLLVRQCAGMRTCEGWRGAGGRRQAAQAGGWHQCTVHPVSGGSACPQHRGPTCGLARRQPTCGAQHQPCSRAAPHQQAGAAALPPCAPLLTASPLPWHDRCAGRAAALHPCTSAWAGGGLKGVEDRAVHRGGFQGAAVSAWGGGASQQQHHEQPHRWAGRSMLPSCLLLCHCSNRQQAQARGRAGARRRMHARLLLSSSNARSRCRPPAPLSWRRRSGQSPTLPSALPHHTARPHRPPGFLTTPAAATAPAASPGPGSRRGSLPGSWAAPLTSVGRLDMVAPQSWVALGTLDTRPLDFVCWLPAVAGVIARPGPADPYPVCSRGRFCAWQAEQSWFGGWGSRAGRAGWCRSWGAAALPTRPNRPETEVLRGLG